MYGDVYIPLTARLDGGVDKRKLDLHFDTDAHGDDQCVRARQRLDQRGVVVVAGALDAELLMLREGGDVRVRASEDRDGGEGRVGKQGWENVTTNVTSCSCEGDVRKVVGHGEVADSKAVVACAAGAEWPYIHTMRHCGGFYILDAKRSMFELRGRYYPPDSCNHDAVQYVVMKHSRWLFVLLPTRDQSVTMGGRIYSVLVLLPICSRVVIKRLHKPA